MIISVIKKAARATQASAIAAFKAIVSWFGWGGLPKQTVYKLAVLPELPTVLEKDFLYVVEEDGFQEQAAMICPCGCGQVLHMNLLDDERPCWKVTINQGNNPSLHPSVWRQKGCKSHFWLKNGLVQFV